MQVGGEARNAQEQIDAIVSFYKWTDAKSSAAVVAAALQLWYYHHPMEEAST